MNSPPPAEHKRATLLDVAKRAGVSRATASLVVRQSSLVGRSTREKVEAAMAELGYVYNVNAARLRRGTSRTIGVIIPNLRNPFFAEMLSGIESVFDGMDMAVMLANSREDPAKQDAFARRMREHDVSGVIVCASAGTSTSFIETLNRFGIAVVQALRRVSQSPADYAGTDYEDGMRQAVQHLRSLGHERITFIAGDQHHSAFDDRLRGFREAASEMTATEVIETALTHQAGRSLGQNILGMKHRPSAAVCFNDVVALGLLRGLFDKGYEVGRDFSVVGFDDVPEAAISRPALTTVATNPFAIGENAAHLLMKRLNDRDAEPKHVIEPTRLVVRDSTGLHARF